VLQENQWNVLRTAFLLQHYESASGKAMSKLSIPLFETSDGVKDKLVSRFAADMYVEDALKHLEERPVGSDPKKTKWGKFFGDYGVGSENVFDDIPRLVLLELLVRALLVCRTCILNSASPKVRRSIEGHFLFKWLINRPLKVAAYLSSLWLREPKAVVATHTAISVAAVLTLTITLVWMDPILYKDKIGNFHPRAFLIMLLLPLLTIMTLIKYGPRHARAVLALLFAMGIGVAALAFFVP